MEHDNKKKSPYKGLFIQIFFYIVVPTLSFILFHWAINEYQTEFTKEHNLLSAVILSLIIGFLFTASTFIAGVAKQPFKVTKNRMAEFVANSKLSVGFAIKNYFYDIKENGIVFLIYFSIFAGEGFFLVKFMAEYYTLYIA